MKYISLSISVYSYPLWSLGTFVFMFQKPLSQSLIFKAVEIYFMIKQSTAAFAYLFIEPLAANII